MGSSQHAPAGLPHWQPCYSKHADRDDAMCGRRLRKAIIEIFQVTGENVQGTIGGLANSHSHYCATYEEYHDQRYDAGSTLYGPHTLDAYIQEFSRASIPLTRPSPTPESAEATASPTPGPTWCNLLLHHQSKLHGELCSRGRFRHPTSFLVTLVLRTLGLDVAGHVGGVRPELQWSCGF